MDIAARIDILHKPEQEVKQMISDYVIYHSDKYIVTRETATITKKIHYHVYIHTRSKQEALRKAWNRKFPEWDGRKQEKAMALVRDLKHYLAYMMKGGEIVMQLGFTTEEIQELKTAWIPDKGSEKTILGKLINFAEETGESYDDLHVCSRIVFRFYLKHGRPMQFFQMKAYAYSLYASKAPDAAENEFVDYATKNLG